MTTYRDRKFKKQLVRTISPDDITIKGDYATMKVALNLDSVLDEIHEACQKSYRRQAEDGDISVSVIDYSLFTGWTDSYDPDIAIFADIEVVVEFTLKESYRHAAEKRKAKAQADKALRLERLRQEVKRLEGEV